jgi:predicted nuclease of predicted toxin-antitoxin system
MRFLIDAQLPPGFAQWLQSHGYEALSVRNAGLQRATDSAIWNYALQNGYVVLTKDEDFVEFNLHTDKGPQVVWLRIGNCTNRVLFGWFEPLLPDVIRHLESGNAVIELRR